ncbi:hypothetical protein LINGRAHAP2_LOCUS2110 [Linum grandiflorum]
MGDKAPQTLFTDQDAAMAPAIKQAFLETYHALYTFHILQNARRNLGPTLCTQDIMRRLICLFYDVDIEQEFDEIWHQMIKECFPSYGDNGHPWMVRSRREAEKQEEFRARNTKPWNSFEYSDVVNKAGQIYTPRLFAMFHEQYARIMEYEIRLGTAAPNSDSISYVIFKKHSGDCIDDRLVKLNVPLGEVKSGGTLLACSAVTP